MTAAPGDEEPDAPRHCREDMILVGSRWRTRGPAAG